MRWSNVLGYALLLWLGQLVFSTLVAYYWVIPGDVSQLRFWVELLAFAALCLVVFVVLGTRNLPHPFVHALCVAALAHLFSVVLTYVLIGEVTYTVLSALELAALLVAMFLGTCIGLMLTANRVNGNAT